MCARFTVLSDTPIASAIAGCVIPLSRSNTIWMRWRSSGSPFQRSAVFNRRTWPLVHLTICSLRIRWSKNHTSRRRENPGHARHPAPQQFRFNQLWQWYEVLRVFEYLAYIVPGSVLLYAVLWLSPELQAPLIEKNIDLGSFGIFVIMALVAGLLLHSIAHYVPEQWVMRPLGLVHQTDSLICSERKLSSNEIRKAIGNKLNEDMDSICASKDPEAKRGVLRRIFAAEQHAGTHHDRVELFEGRYYMMLDLAGVF